MKIKTKVHDQILPISFFSLVLISIISFDLQITVGLVIGNLYFILFILPFYMMIYIFSKFIKVNTRVTLNQAYEKVFKKKLVYEANIFVSIFLLFTIYLLSGFDFKELISLLWTGWYIWWIIIVGLKTAYSYQIYIDSPNDK
ncbi:MAG: hypothetical protein OIF32_12060 [Campylobacterales bacterium]|nr:hypothetical protein [Campylobacterales bacterium]